MKGNKETLISAQEKLQSNSQTEFPNFWRFSKMAQDLNRELNLNYTNTANIEPVSATATTAMVSSEVWSVPTAHLVG